eukprot:99078-Pleurochrysis_carterae.AAC.1
MRATRLRALRFHPVGLRSLRVFAACTAKMGGFFTCADQLCPWGATVLPARAAAKRGTNAKQRKFEVLFIFIELHFQKCSAHSSAYLSVQCAPHIAHKALALRKPIQHINMPYSSPFSRALTETNP